jgi:hypothetical protein
MHLAEVSAGILAQFCFVITLGEDRFRGSSSVMHESAACRNGGNAESATEVWGSWLDSGYRPYRPTVALLGWTRFPRSADLGVQRRRHKVAEWPLGFDKLWPHPVDGAVDRGSPNAEQFGEFGLGVVA